MGIMNLNKKGMKNLNIIRQISLLLLCAGLFSCSNDENILKLNEPQESTVSATVENLNLPANLKCDMYIFWKPSGNADYTFKENYTLAGTQSRMKFMNNELVNKDYRFLFVATSKITPEINVTALDGNALSTNDKWTDVLISANDILISADNYSGILDKNGDYILNGGSIDGVLTRMVGQMVLDIFRVNGSIKDPMNIISDNVTSVLDRVFKVETEYEGITQSVVFDNSKKIHDKKTWQDKHTQTLLFTTDNNLKVSVPQINNGLETSPVGMSGSARIKGIYCLPSTENIRVKLTFHYYDTTPTCGNSHGNVHNESCFDQRKLILNLPQDETEATLLSVKPDYFTVNKAGIRFDRIIDLKMESSIAFETDWKKSN